MRVTPLVVCCAVLLAGCASTSATKQAAVSSAGTPVTAPATASTTQAAAGQEVVVGSGSMQVRADAPAVGKTRSGYRLRQREGQAYYCRTETPTGSRMPVETCYTAAQLEVMDAQAETAKDSLSKARTPCAGPTCGG
jgi:hypothetical protein